MGLQIKPGVRLHESLAMAVGLLVVQSAFLDYGIPGCQITSGAEGKHMVGSKHPLGRAFDFRTHGLSVDRRSLCRRLSIALGGTGKEATYKDTQGELNYAFDGGEFDVIFEGDGTPNEHIHVEFDPEPVRAAVTTDA